MKKTLLAGAIGVALSFASIPADASSVSERQSGQAFLRWTPEQFRDATPMDLPLAQGRLEPLAMDALSPQAAAPTRFEPGSLPSDPEPRGMQLRLYTPEPELEPEPEPEIQPQSALTPQSTGHAGAVFTQSRVHPPIAVRRVFYRMTGKLFGRDPRTGQEFTCSAAVIQMRLVSTAGHCVYNAVEQYFYTDFVFIPAYHQGKAPFGAWSVERGLTTRSWVEGRGDLPNAADFAILVMQNSGRARMIGEFTGWMSWATQLAAFSHVTIFGYPADLDRGERMQKTSSETFAFMVPNAAVFGSGMTGGSSGGPFIVNFGPEANGQIRELRNIMVGVLSFGFETREIQHVGTSIINAEFAAMFDAACRANRNNCVGR